MRRRRLTATTVMALAPAVLAAAPPAPPRSPEGPPGAYERLDIAERRITQAPYRTSLELVVDDARGILVRVGVALTADRIDVLLRNVKGSYSFRADFDGVRPGRSTPPQP